MLEPELVAFDAAVGGEECAPGFATATPAVSATSAPTEVPAAMARLRFMRRCRDPFGFGVGSGSSLVIADLGDGREKRTDRPTGQHAQPGWGGGSGASGTGGPVRSRCDGAEDDL